MPDTFPGKHLSRDMGDHGDVLFVEMFAGVLVMLASDKRQRLGNVATNTLVVRAKRSSR